jgi:hypothetical protein
MVQSRLFVSRERAARVPVHNLCMAAQPSAGAFARQVTPQPRN